MTNKKKNNEKNLPAEKQETLPSYINPEGNRGSENVEMEDLVIPRIDLAQALSPVVIKSKPEYIDGAMPGMMFNSVTRELYGEEIHIVPVLFKKDYIVWRDRQEGGGYRGAFDTELDAAKERDKLDQEAGKKVHEVMDTAQHIVYIVRNDGTYEEAVLSMSRSKMKVSRNFNSIIRLAGGDRFSRMYKVVVVPESNDKGDFFNLSIRAAGFPSEAVYKQAEKLYEDIKSGSINVSADTSDMDSETDVRDNEEY